MEDPTHENHEVFHCEAYPAQQNSTFTDRVWNIVIAVATVATVVVAIW